MDLFEPFLTFQHVLTWLHGSKSWKFPASIESFEKKRTESLHVVTEVKPGGVGVMVWVNFSGDLFKHTVRQLKLL